MHSQTVWLLIAIRALVEGLRVIPAHIAINAIFVVVARALALLMVIAQTRTANMLSRDFLRVTSRFLGVSASIQLVAFVFFIGQPNSATGQQLGCVTTRATTDGPIGGFQITNACSEHQEFEFFQMHQSFHGGQYEQTTFFPLRTPCLQPGGSFFGQYVDKGTGNYQVRVAKATLCGSSKQSGAVSPGSAGEQPDPNFTRRPRIPPGPPLPIVVRYRCGYPGQIVIRYLAPERQWNNTPVQELNGDLTAIISDESVASTTYPNIFYYAYIRNNSLPWAPVEYVWEGGASDNIKYQIDGQSVTLRSASLRRSSNAFELDLNCDSYKPSNPMPPPEILYGDRPYSGGNSRPRRD